VRTTKTRFARTVATLATASLLLAACGGGDDGGGGGGGGGGGEGDTTGVTDTSVKVGTHMPITGVASPGYNEIPTGVQAYFEFVNAQGGVNGRQIEYIVENDEYSPPKTAEVVDKLILEDEVFAILGGLGTPTHTGVLETLNSDEVPDLFVSSGALAWDQPDKYPWTFGYQPDYEVEGKVLGQYVKENFPDAKVGLFLQADDLGADGAKGVKQIIGDQIVKEVSYVTTELATQGALGGQVGELRGAGVDLVIGFNVPTASAIMLSRAREVQYQPTVMFSSVAADATLVGGVIARGAAARGQQITPEQGAQVMNGTYATSYFPTVDLPDNPWVQKFGEIWGEYGDGGPLTNFRIYGMMQAYLFVSALQAAGEDLTREGIVEAIESEGSSWKGPWLAPLDYSEESHRGISGVQVVQLQGGAPVQKTEIQVTDPGEGEIEEFTEEPDEPTENGIPSAE